jgi:predicted phage terminase large subunit-like protein
MYISGIEKDDSLALIKGKCLGSLLFFVQTFFKLETGRDFVLSNPIGRECHQVTICRELMNIFYLRENRLIINIPPGHGKSTLISYFIPWAFAHYADCQFLYISYSHDLATKHTARIKNIMQMSEYKQMFGVEISKDSSAKDDFKTTSGGAVKAFGSSSGITGQDAGLPHLNRFSGAVLMDDMHKPDEVYSDTIRSGVISTYNNTIKPRPRSPNVGMVLIAQMLHEDDVCAYLRRGDDGQHWNKIILPARDDAGNILAPAITPREMLEREEKFNPYVFSAQYQQNPMPSGGGIFKSDCFEFLSEEPDCLITFLTVDTAETSKTYNDATVFSFWGLYEIEEHGRKTNEFGLHWIDCVSFHVEPSELEEKFRSFYSSCLLYKKKPTFSAIEKKSTGTTLLSVLKKYRGMEVRDIERTRASRSKIDRYLEIQPYIARRLISFPKYAKHIDMCITQCKGITANNTHRNDDIVDTMYDAIKIALIDKVLQLSYNTPKTNSVVSEIASHINQINRIRAQAWQS